MCEGPWRGRAVFWTRRISCPGLGGEVSQTSCCPTSSLVEAGLWHWMHVCNVAGTNHTTFVLIVYGKHCYVCYFLIIICHKVPQTLIFSFLMIHFTETSPILTCGLAHTKLLLNYVSFSMRTHESFSFILCFMRAASTADHIGLLFQQMITQGLPQTWPNAKWSTKKLPSLISWTLQSMRARDKYINVHTKVFYKEEFMRTGVRCIGT